MSEKIPLKEVLAAVDMNAKSMWSELDDTQQKALKSEMYILNRYISNVKGQSRELQEHFVLTVNEFFNKHWNTLQKHPQLLWQLLCMCGHESQRIFFHEWIGFKKKQGKSADSKIIKFFLELYPCMKEDEVVMKASLTTLAEAKKLAKEHGYDDKQIEKMFK